MSEPYHRLTWPLFLEFIRLPAKAASMLPFVLGISYAGWAFQQFSWVNSLIYGLAQLAIALFVTGFNNVQDYLKPKIKAISNGKILLAVSTCHRGGCSP